MSETLCAERPMGASDFDFIHDRWTVEHRKLARRLVGSNEWLTFRGTVSGTPILGGLGNTDENMLDDPSGAYEALTVRTFDPGSGEWSIVWIDGRDPKPDAPVRGHFVDGVGTFQGDDVLAGQPILVRFTWSGITPGTARWEQAFSADAGATWELNWIMQFTRV